MCGRYFNERSVFVALPLFGIWVRGDYQPSSNIAPSETVPIVHKENEKLVCDPMSWGYQPGWDKGPKFLINLKSETIAQKHFARASLQHKRCVFPASGFFEWRTEPSKKKTPFAFHMEDKAVFGMAGLFFTPQEQKKECLILTTDANSVVSKVHNRMPVTLLPEDWNEWLTGTEPAKLLEKYAHPFTRKELSMQEVDPAYNKAGFKAELSKH